MKYTNKFLASLIVYATVRYSLPRYILDETIYKKQLIVHSICYAFAFVIFKHLSANKYI